MSYKEVPFEKSEEEKTDEAEGQHMELRAEILLSVISIVGSVVFLGFTSNRDADEDS